MKIKKVLTLGLNAALFFSNVAFAQTIVMTSDEHRTFEKWEKRARSYMDKVNQVIEKSLTTPAKHEDGTIAGDDATQRMQQRCRFIIDGLGVLHPSDEFKQYHAKLIESYKYALMATIVLGNERASLKYNRLSEISKREAMEIFKNIYISHKASKQDIEKMSGILEWQDRSIREYSEAR
jgi:hypothetical protein